MAEDVFKYFRRRKRMDDLVRAKEKNVLVDVSGVAFSRDVFKSLRLHKPYSVVDQERSMSRTQLGKILGVHLQEITRWESKAEGSIRIPRLENFKKIALYFQVDPLVLLGLTWMKNENAKRLLREIKGIDPYNDFCKVCGKFKGDSELILSSWDRMNRGRR